ncbi:hypothetical protein B0T25DRAFT_70977 [Lasiosphaeria hispida]|uniref:Uncharacterized protein n=1 Tax=Lasiosphaeria hispida TaxID=260671 RepID=A0AAJ0MLD1_9PEZI|nr:hypothetical protein B0T25DRAFT_70977 [Lasiosphaeria hispida]
MEQMPQEHEPGLRQQVAPTPPLPFSCNILNGGEGDDHNREKELLDQFPASYRVDDDIRAPVTPELDLIAREMNVKRLQDIIHLLWLAGRPVPPRPLHFQLSLGREITVREQMEAHLVWGSGRIFIKPIPRYLLNPHFWEKHLFCDQCRGQGVAKFDDTASSRCTHRQLRACALGFLLSYVALVAYESDFTIAKERRLIPAEVTWLRWREFVREILAGESANRLYTHVAPRFIYGELRLNRLNLICLALQGPLSSGFVATWHSFGSFYRDNSAWIITITAYVILILSAVQVGLTTSRLSGNEVFQAAAYGFSIFAILIPIFTLGLLVTFSAILWAYNVMRTRRFEAKRSKTLSRAWRSKERKSNSTD